MESSYFFCTIIRVVSNKFLNLKSFKAYAIVKVMIVAPSDFIDELMAGSKVWDNYKHQV